MRRTSLILGLILTSTLVHLTAFGGLAQGQTQGPRDTSARTAEVGAPAAIEGRIVAASTGQPLRRARVVATARDFLGRSQPRPMRPGAMSSRIFGRAATP